MFEVKLYEKENGEIPVEEFLDELPANSNFESSFPATFPAYSISSLLTIRLC